MIINRNRKRIIFINIKYREVPSSSWMKLLSIVPIVSKPFVLLVNISGDEVICVVGLTVEVVTGYNGIGRGVRGFVGRIGGRVGYPPRLIPEADPLPPVILQHPIYSSYIYFAISKIF